MQAAKVRANGRAVADGRADELLVRLRRATAAAHRGVEARLFPAGLQDRASYVAMLQVLLALHEPVEGWLAKLPGLPALGIDPAERRKAPRLRADLAALGVDEPPAARPACGGTSAMPEALGAIYVLEGSTLGGRVLLEQVRVRLGDVPTNFLLGYGTETARYWRRTRAALVEGVRTDSDPADAEQRLIAAAMQTFEYLERLLDEDGWAAV
jgi:heme oxygenase